MSVYLINGIQHYINVSLEDLPCRRRGTARAQNWQQFFPSSAATLQPGQIQPNLSGVAPLVHCEPATSAEPHVAPSQYSYGNQSLPNNDGSQQCASSSYYDASQQTEPTSAGWFGNASRTESISTNRSQQFPTHPGYVYDLHQTHPYGSTRSSGPLASSNSETDTDYGTDDTSDNITDSFVPSGFFDQPALLWCEANCATTASSRSSSLSFIHDPSNIISDSMVTSFECSTRRYSEISCQTPFAETQTDAAFGGFRSSLEPFHDHNLSSQCSY